MTVIILEYNPSDHVQGKLPPGTESNKQETLGLDLCSHKLAVFIKPDRPT